MALLSGTRVGPYEILAPVGAGGMGEVYRARDSRLGRDVAVKVLPSQFSLDTGRLHRFEQESRAAGVLNHPSILTIYDVGTSEGCPYLVSELLEGETLRSRLQGGRLPLRKATDYAIQIARGLAAAHEKGIVHRDLKPDNLFICRDGRVKILDFGLAKLIQPESADLAQTSAQTISDQTHPGVVLGTAGYMAPEQVRGRPVDHRSDIFAFGTILYEMISGKRAFSGETAADTLSAILKEDPPDLVATDRSIPPALDRIVRHCLEKNPEERFQSARDLAFHLESLSTISETSAAVMLPKAQRRKWPLDRAWLWVLVALLLANLGLGIWWLRMRAGAAASMRAVQFQRLTDFIGLEEFPSISPDGKSVLFTADTTGTRQIWVRLMAGGAPLEITHDESDHLYPRWSPDSGSIIYYLPPRPGEAQGTLWEVSALGGPARRLANSLGGADVSHAGNKLVFFRLESGQVQLVVSDRDGSNPRVVTQQVPRFGYLHPRWSPDDHLIAYQHNTSAWADHIYLVAASGGEPRQLTHDPFLMNGLTWLADGSGLVYSSARGSTVLYLPILQLWLVRLDGAGSRQLTYGDAVYEHPDVDRLGRIVASRRRMQFDIWKYPVDASPSENVRRAVRITHQTGQVQTPTVGPSDRELAYLWESGGHGNIWVRKLDSGEVRQITYEHDPGVTLGVPIWSTDGKHITFASTRTTGRWGDVGYWVVDPDGSSLRNVIKLGGWATWSGDGRWIYYSEPLSAESAEVNRICKISIEGGDPVTVRTDNAISPAVAPDGSALYYVIPLQNVNGMLDYEIRVARPEDGPSRLLTRIPGSKVPIWQGLHPVISHDGNWLALPLNDNFGTNIWLLSTSDGKLRQATDFGARRTFIARRLSWSNDDRFLYAAVGEGDADVVLLGELVP